MPDHVRCFLSYDPRTVCEEVNFLFTSCPVCVGVLKFIGVDLFAAWSCVMIPEALGMCCDSRGTRPCASDVELNCERFDAASETRLRH